MASEQAHARAPEIFEREFYRQLETIEARVEGLVDERVAQYREQKERESSAALAVCVTEHRSYVDTWNEQQSRHLVSLAVKHENEVRELEQKFAVEREVLEQSIRQSAFTSEQQLRDACQQRIIEAKSSHEQEVRELDEQHEEQMRSLQSKHRE